MKYWFLISLLIFSVACKSKKKAKDKEMENTVFVLNNTPGAKAIVYKTIKNYDKFVAIIMSQDGKEILSYPDPKDVASNGDLIALPTVLKQGYLLDNRGIGPQVAFLKISYKDFGKLMTPPSLEDMQAMILEKSPLLEMYDCGNRDSIKNLTQTLNSLIEKKQLDKVCKKLY